MSVNWAQLYADLSAQLQAHVDLPFYQDFFVNFYRAFIDGARWKLYLSGLRMTIEVTVLALIMGIILGVIVAVIRTAHDQQRPGRHNPILFLLNTIGTIYTTVIRGTPMIVQMLIMGSIIFASSRNFTVIGTIALGINSGAYVAEIIRGGIMAVDEGQNEAGRSLGLNFAQTMLYIIIPQALKNVLPALANEFIVLLKETSVACYVAVNDLTKGGEIIRSQTYIQAMPLLIVAALYLIMVVFFSHLVSKLERRLRSSDH